MTAGCKPLADLRTTHLNLVAPQRAGSVYVARVADPGGYDIEIYAAS